MALDEHANRIGGLVTTNGLPTDGGRVADGLAYLQSILPSEEGALAAAECRFADEARAGLRRQRCQRGVALHHFRRLDPLRSQGTCEAFL
jgi:hypothetical protein